MERIVSLQIEKLPEGFYLATSDDVPGLVVQASTITETLEIAKDVANKLMEAQDKRQPIKLRAVEDCFEYPLILPV